MHKVEKIKVSAIINLLKAAESEFIKEGLAGKEDTKSAGQYVHEAIDAVESWEDNEVETEEITKACESLRKAIEVFPEKASNDARVAIDSALTDLEQEEQKAKEKEK